MTTKYLEIDSQYRNRSLWPKPGEFEVIIQKSGQCESKHAQDPVSTATPKISFTSNRFQANTPNSPNIIGTVFLTGIGAANATTKTIIFQTDPGKLQQLKNYYKHAVVSISNSDERARIRHYEYMGGDKGRLYTDIDIIIADGTVITIEDPTDFSDPSYVHVFIPTGSNSPDDYIDNILYNESLNEFRTIIEYNSVLGTVKPGGDPVIGWLSTHNYSIRKTPPFLVTKAGAGSTPKNVILTKGSAAIGQFIRIPQTEYTNIVYPPQSEIRRIIDYIPNPPTAIVSPPFTANPTGEDIEILDFSYDNFHPFIYTGSKQNELIIYKIKLNSLVIPNQILSVGTGGKIAFYPYIYVHLTIEGQAKNILYSNNPHSTTVLFRASITDIQNLTASTFITLRGDDSTIQTIRFKTETNFKFKVTLPNGEVFETVLDENFSPMEPNPLIQISALFELTKI